MKTNRLHFSLKILFLLSGIGFLPVHQAQAQDMVTATGENGLEKTVSYDVEKFTDIRDKKL